MTAFARRSAIVPALVACVFHVARAEAAEPTASEVDARYAAVESALVRGAPAARLWWTGWVTGYAVLTVGQGTAALVVKDDGLRVDAIVGGASSLLALGSTALGSRTAFTAPGELEKMDARTPAARRLRLRRAEELLKQAAEAERFGRSPLVHWGGALVTLTGTFVLWIGYQRYASGWLNLLTSTAVGELQILTQPSDAIVAWNEFRSGRLPARARAESSWVVAPWPGGLGVSGRF